jgi:hypothetical protein
MRLMLAGGMLTAYAVAALFFLRFWRQSHDRLFALFGVAFLLLAVQRLAITVLPETAALALWPYVVRLAAFLVILWAIADKNRKGRA